MLWLCYKLASGLFGNTRDTSVMHEKAKFVCFNYMQPRKVKLKSVQINLKHVSYILSSGLGSPDNQYWRPLKPCNVSVRPRGSTTNPGYRYLEMMYRTYRVQGLDPLTTSTGDP